METILIRPANTNDLESILCILNDEIKFGTSVYDYKEKSLSDIQTWYQEKRKHKFPVLVAQINNEVIGYSTYGYFRPREGYQFSIEHSVYLSKNSQGKGVGKLLMDNLIAIAIDQGFHRMLAVVDANNIGSCRFHEKLGFKEVGKMTEVGYKFDKWLDVIIMQLNLDTININ